jgi:radical SAM enzyme (TIGR01210 family)
MTDAEIIALRGPKNALDPNQPYHFFIEREVSRFGVLEDAAVVLLTNRECPFRCLMCDLWRNTLDVRVPVGAIGRQIDFALGRLPAVQHVKLYNSGNFFDPQAIPPEEFPAIAERLGRMRTVIVENHPRLCNDSCTRFRDLLPASTELEIAIGLETVHAEVLHRLNKRMTVEDFARSVEFLNEQRIPTRAFILLRPPFLTEEEGVDWALRSIEYAFAAGVRCCSVIATRAGNGMMDKLQEDGQFWPPHLNSLELVLETALSWRRGRVFADLWEGSQLRSCPRCADARRRRIETMNQTQKIPGSVFCSCRESHD